VFVQVCEPLRVERAQSDRHEIRGVQRKKSNGEGGHYAVACEQQDGGTPSGAPPIAFKPRAAPRAHSLGTPGFGHERRQGADRICSYFVDSVTCHVMTSRKAANPGLSVAVR
jgi:hypothetical protein